MSDTTARLLSFTIELNRDGNLEIELDSVDTREMEIVLNKLGFIDYSYKVSDVVRSYYSHISSKISS